MSSTYLVIGKWPQLIFLAAKQVLDSINFTNSLTDIPLFYMWKFEIRNQNEEEKYIISEYP